MNQPSFRKLAAINVCLLTKANKYIACHAVDLILEEIKT